MTSSPITPLHSGNVFDPEVFKDLRAQDSQRPSRAEEFARSVEKSSTKLMTALMRQPPDIDNKSDPSKMLEMMIKVWETGTKVKSDERQATLMKTIEDLTRQISAMGAKSLIGTEGLFETPHFTHQEGKTSTLHIPDHCLEDPRLVITNASHEILDAYVLSPQEREVKWEGKNEQTAHPSGTYRAFIVGKKAGSQELYKVLPHVQHTIKSVDLANHTFNDTLPTNALRYLQDASLTTER